MKIHIYEKDIRITFKKFEVVIYRWFPYSIRKVVYGHGTYEMEARSKRRFRAQAKQILDKWGEEVEAQRKSFPFKFSTERSGEGKDELADGSSNGDNEAIPGGERKIPNV